LADQRRRAYSVTCVVLQVICFGMSLPLSEHDTIRDCVHVYCEWLSALHPVPKICVPRPVCEDPNLYARKMICHFHNLFVPRKGEGKLDSRLFMFCNIFIGSFAQIQGHNTALIRTCTIYCSVAQKSGRCPVPGPGINYTGPREVLLEFVILVF